MAETFPSIVDSIHSLEVFAVVKVAIVVCWDPELKREILYKPCGLIYQCEDEHAKERWNETIEKKTRVILKEYRLPETLQEKMISAVYVIGIRMVIWAEYHERILELTRKFSMDFLKASFFTPLGLIDRKKAAEALMNVKSLAIHQKYKIACLYCFIDHIPALFRQMSSDDIEKHTNIRQPGLVRFWSYYLKGEVDKIKGEQTPDQYFLDLAVEVGSKAAVEYCFEQAISKKKEFEVVYAALKALRSKNEEKEDTLIFFDYKYSIEILWVPTDYHVDIVSFLFSKMREDEQLEFLQKDIEDNYGRSKVLEYHLKWPYQDNFMKVANLMWDFLPDRCYANLLLKICHLIEPRVGFAMDLKYGEEKIYDYRGLLTEFWHQSPDRFKRYVFNKDKLLGDIQVLHLLTRLLQFEKFTNEDAKIIKLILSSSMLNEIENIFVSIEWSDMWARLMGKEKWIALDVLAVNWFSNKEEIEKFKREFISTEKARRVCLGFVEIDQWNSVETALKWSSLPEEEIDKLKKHWINSPYGRKECRNLISKDKFETFYKFVKWCLPSAEEAKAFKKQVVYTRIVMEKCGELAANEASEVLDRFINYCLSSTEEIKIFIKDLAYRVGGHICGKLISHTLEKAVYIEKESGRFVGKTFSFQGGKWEQVEKFLTWCFSSEKEIEEFKRKQFKKLTYIHHNLILASQWEQAEIYFAWLGLSAEEIKDLKKDDFFNSYMTSSAFRDLFYKYSGEVNYFFSDFGNDQEASELILRWYLTDRETALEFSNEFKLKYLEDKSESKSMVKYAFKKFDLAIAQRLGDLEEEEKIGLKRKSENSSSSKRFCN